MADKDAPETALVLVIFVSAPEASIFLTLGTLEDNIEILFSINHIAYTPVVVRPQRLDVEVDCPSVAAREQVAAHLIGGPLQVVDVAYPHGRRVGEAAARLIPPPIWVKVHVTHWLLQTVACVRVQSSTL